MIRAAQLILPALLALSCASLASADPVDPTAPAPVAASAPAPATGPATTVSPATVPANPQDKVVCKYETPIGSRLGGHRTCMRKSDWDAQSQQAQKVMGQRLGSGTSVH